MTATQQAPDQPIRSLPAAGPAVKGLTPNIDVPAVQKRPRRPAPWPLDLYQTAVGKKWVMAVSGAGLMLFLFAHMIGNLKLFLSAAELDEYSAALRELLYPILPNTVFLWIMRAGLIAFFAIHMHAAYSLTVMNHRARPTKYSKRDYIAANWANRTMRYSGVIIFAFLLIHLANLTWGWQFLDNDQWVFGQVYNNVTTSLSQWWLAGIYIIGQLALAPHLFHGSWSLFQSLGINSPRLNPLRKGFAYAFTAIIVIPNLSFPIAVVTGAVR